MTLDYGFVNGTFSDFFDLNVSERIKHYGAGYEFYKPLEQYLATR